MIIDIMYQYVHVHALSYKKRFHEKSNITTLNAENWLLVGLPYEPSLGSVFQTEMTLLKLGKKSVIDTTCDWLLFYSS